MESWKENIETHIFKGIKKMGCRGADTIMNYIRNIIIIK